MDDRNVGRYVDTAILLGSGKAEHMVILVDGAAHCAECVMAIGQYIRNGKPLHPGCLGCLHDSHKCDIVAGHAVKTELKMFHIVRCVVCLKNGICNGSLSGSFLIRFPAGQGFHFPAFCFRNNSGPVYQVNTAFI